MPTVKKYFRVELLGCQAMMVISIILLQIVVWSVFRFWNMIISPDGFYYLSQAEVIKEFGLFRFAEDNISIPYYWFFPFLLYLYKSLVGASFLSLAIVIQFTLSCANIFLLIRLYFIVFEERKGQWLVLFLAAICYDILQWGHYLLTDIYSIFLILLYLVFCVSQKRTSNFLTFFILPLLAMMLITLRGANMIVVIASIVYFIYRKDFKKFPGLLIVILLISFLAGSHSKDNASYSLDSRQYLYKNNALKGQIIDDRPRYDIEPYKNGVSKALFYAKLLILRTLNYWRFYSEEFSTKHNFFNLLFFPACYLGFLFFLFRTSRPISLPQSLLLYIMLFFMIGNIVTMIDYDWRYRVPVLSLMIIFSARGWYLVCSRLPIFNPVLPNPLPAKQNNKAQNGERI